MSDGPAPHRIEAAKAFILAITPQAASTNLDHAALFLATLTEDMARTRRALEGLDKELSRAGRDRMAGR